MRKKKMNTVEKKIRELCNIQKRLHKAQKVKEKEIYNSLVNCKSTQQADELLRKYFGLTYEQFMRIMMIDSEKRIDK